MLDLLDRIAVTEVNMKRWVKGSLVFFVTLATGYGLAFLTLPSTNVKPIPSSQAEPVAVITTPAPAARAFIPEFTSLPNFEEFFGGEPTGKLVDIQEGSRDAIYRSSEVVAETGETWLGFFEHNGNYELKPTRASIKQLRSVSWPGDENDAKLTFEGQRKPIFAVKNIETLKPGTVTNIYHRPSTAEIERRNLPIISIEEGYKHDFDLNDKLYALRFSRGLTKDDTEVAVLVLEHEKEKQVIYFNKHIEGERDILGDLLWVGDLDNDGKLDIYFAPYNEKGGLSFDLFLSSTAEPGDLVKLAASFSITGC